jgi:hypothetical protein
MTLRGVFESMNLTAYDLTVDMLDVHAVSTSHEHQTQRTTYKSNWHIFYSKSWCISSTYNDGFVVLLAPQ